MTETDVDRLIRWGEGGTVEFRERVSQSLARQFAGFANVAGGKVLVGVDDTGSVVGVEDSNALRARIQDLARNCDPPVPIVVEPVGRVLVIQVRESEDKPVQCADGFFVRQGAATQKLTQREVRDFFRSEGAIRFDLTPCPRFRYPDDFDRERFDAWLRLSDLTGEPPVEEVLVNLGVAERAGDTLRFRNAGVLFFAREPRRFFPDAYLTCFLAKGGDRTYMLDRGDYGRGIVRDIEDAMRFVDRNTRTAQRIEGLKRDEISEYPRKAVREAITNAVMHRDWFFEGANVFVEVYSDRLEIVSPGSLPTGLSEADLGNRSVRRNPLVADLLHRIGYIEKAGTGIRRIREEAEHHGCPEPTFTSDRFFTVTFRPRPDVRSGAGAGVEGPGTERQAQPVTPPVGRSTPHETPHDGGATPPVGRSTPHETPHDGGVTPPVGRSTPRETSHDGGVTPPVGCSTPRETPHDGGVTPSVGTPAEKATPDRSGDPGPAAPEGEQARLLRALSEERSAPELLKALHLRNRKHLREALLRPALREGLVEMTLPDKPRSRRQRYRLTDAGRDRLERSADGVGEPASDPAK